jgi:hypothetical protein
MADETSPPPRRRRKAQPDTFLITLAPGEKDKIRRVAAAQDRSMRYVIGIYIAAGLQRDKDMWKDTPDA